MTGGQKSTLLSRIDRVLTILDRILIGMSCLSLFLIILIVFFDVLSRYIFNAPFAWSYTLIGFYLMTAAFFFAISDAFRYQAHVKIDFMSHLIPIRIRAFFVFLGYLSASLVVFFWTEQSRYRMLSAFVNDERLAASIPWPTWIAYAIVLIGSTVFALSLLVVSFKYLFFSFSSTCSEEQYQSLEGELLDSDDLLVDEEGSL